MAKGVNTSDKTKVKIPKRQESLDFSGVPLFDVDRWMKYGQEPEQSISPLEQGYDIPEYSQFTRNLSENLEGSLDIVSPLDDIYEASGGEDPYVNLGLDMLGPGELLASAKGAATIIPLLKSPTKDVVRLFHGSPTRGNIFTDPMLREAPTKGSTFGDASIYTGDRPSKARWFAREFNAPEGYQKKGSIYAFDIPVDEFKENIYRPWISEDKIPAGIIPKDILSKSTDRRKYLQERAKALGGTDLTMDEEDFLLHGVMPFDIDPRNPASRDIAKYLRDKEGVIGAGPFYEVQSPEYTLYKDMKPSYEILLAPEDYWTDEITDLGNLYDKRGNNAFDALMNSQMSPYIKATDVK